MKRLGVDVGGTFTDVVFYDSTGRKVEFQHGVIDIHPTAGTHGVWGPIFRAWSADYGRETGELGFPTTTVRAIDERHVTCDFQNGTLIYDRTTGVVTRV